MFRIFWTVCTLVIMPPYETVAPLLRPVGILSWSPFATKGDRRSYPTLLCPILMGSYCSCGGNTNSGQIPSINVAIGLLIHLAQVLSRRGRCRLRPAGEACL